VKVGLEPAGFRLRLEAQRMVGPAGDPVVDIGAEVKLPAMPARLDLELDRQERRVVDHDPAFLDRRDQEVLVAFPLEHRGEQLDQRQPSDRRLQVEPGAVGGDAHVEIAAEGRIPQVHRRRALAGRLPDCARDGVQPARLPFLRHGLPGTWDRDRLFSTRSRSQASLSTAARKARAGWEKPQVSGLRDPLGSAGPGAMADLQESGVAPVKNSVIFGQLSGVGA
jgi:hypothetical protein